MKHIVQFSFGESSWWAAKCVAAKYGVENTIMVFADTKEEDEDTYRWGRAAAANVGSKLYEISDGRNIWEVFADEKLIGDSRYDPCSKILKRRLSKKFIGNHFDPHQCTIYVGISLFEADRMESIQKGWKPFKVESPLLWKPYPSPAFVREQVLANGLWVQRLYQMGFSHANCGGQCVKAGQAQWKLLLEKIPDRYLRAEAKEEELMEKLGRGHSILKTTKGGVVKPLTLRMLREQVEAGQSPDEGKPESVSCSCMSGTDEE